MKQITIIVLVLCLTSCLSNNLNNKASERFGKIILDSLGDVNMQMTILNDDHPVIPIEITNDFINLSNLIDHIEFIPLETSEKCLIGRINKIMFDGNQFYILDKHIRKTLLIFDNKGKFIKKVGDIGRGPGEYMAITDFIVNESGIAVVDGAGHKLLYYDKDGIYQYSVPLKYLVKEIFLTAEDDLFLVRAGDNRHIKEIAGYELIAISKDGKILSKALNNRVNINYSIDVNGQYINSKTTYHRPLSSEIYEITGDTIRLKYLLDFKGKGFPSNFAKVCNGNFDVFEKEYLNSYSFLLGKYLETDNYLIMRISDKNKPLSLFIYNVDSKEITSGIPQMYHGGDSFDVAGLIACSMTDEMFVYNNEIIGAISPMLFDGIDKYPIQKEKFLNNADITFGDNPVIYTLKLR